MSAKAALELLVQLRDEASAGLSSLGGAMGNVGMIAGGAALAGVVALGAAIVGGVGDAQEARALYAATEQVIKTTGGAAGVSAQQVTDLASALSDASGKSLFGDDQIQAAENVLLTFTNIGKDVFPAATQATIDMAAALKTTPEAMDTLIGKALNTADGYKTLKKSGVDFTEQQSAQIDAMFAAGDAAGAQTIILDELNKKYGGQAAAAAGAAGGLVQFKAGLGETFETIGGKLLPILDKFGAWLNSPDVKQSIEFLATALADGIGVAVAYLSDVAIPALMQAWTDMKPTVMATIAFIQSDVLPVLKWLADVVIAGAILQLRVMGWVWTNVLLPNIQTAVAWFVANLLPTLTTIFVALRDDLPRGIAVAVQGWNDFKTALGDFKTGYIDPIVNGFNFVVGAVANAQKQFDSFIGGVTNAVIPSWLQGHSPPPLAEWFSSIAGAADAAGGAVGGVAPPGGTVPSLPAFAGAQGASGGIAVYVTVQGSVTTQQDLVRSIRDSLNQIGRQNVSIFSPDVTP
jgi:hypothetical protein